MKLENSNISSNNFFLGIIYYIKKILILLKINLNYTKIVSTKKKIFLIFLKRKLT